MKTALKQTEFKATSVLASFQEGTVLLPGATVTIRITAHNITGEEMFDRLGLTIKTASHLYKVSVLIYFLPELALPVPMFSDGPQFLLYGCVLLDSVFTDLVLTVQMCRTRLVLTVLIFLTGLVSYWTDVSD
jgi:hypothetical protein